MDTNKGPAHRGWQRQAAARRIRDELEAMGHAAADLLEHLVRVPAALAQIPLQYLPEDTPATPATRRPRASRRSRRCSTASQPRWTR